MSSSNEQNGRQGRQLAPQQTTQTPLTDPRIRNANANPSTVPPVTTTPNSSTATPTTASTTSNEQNKRCKDFVWGICSMGGQCKFKHELDFEFMKSILKFCHDYQNRQGCLRTDCTYLHTSQEEEKLFLTTGRIPRVLAERYASKSSLPANNSTTEQSIPPMYANTPQPPLPPIPGVPGAQLSPMVPLLMPPPPPPPPTTTSTPPVLTPPLYTAPPPIAVTAPGPFAMMPSTAVIRPSLPAIELSKFDPTRPPPPLPVNIQRTNKRSADPIEAGTSCKARKTDNTNDSLCENCVQRELRIELSKQELDKLQRVEEYQRIIYDKKTEEYENGKLLMKTLVSPEMFRILEDYIEMNGTTQSSHSPTMNSSPPPSATGSEFLLHLFEYVYGRKSNGDIASAVSSCSQEDSILQSLTSLTRNNFTTVNSSNDPVQNLLELLQNGSSDSSSSPTAAPHDSELNRTTSAVGQTRVTLVSSRVSSTVTNGLSRCVNGQRVDPAGPPEPNTPRLNVAGAPTPPGPRPFCPTGDGAQVTPPVGFIPFTPAVPPSITRPYGPYQFPNAPLNVPNPAPSGNQPPRQTTPTSQVPPGNYQQFMGRYPPPPYFSPFQ